MLNAYRCASHRLLWISLGLFNLYIVIAYLLENKSERAMEIGRPNKLIKCLPSSCVYRHFRFRFPLFFARAAHPCRFANALILAASAVSCIPWISCSCPRVLNRWSINDLIACLADILHWPSHPSSSKVYEKFVVILLWTRRRRCSWVLRPTLISGNVNSIKVMTFWVVLWGG